jgi:hypothetical protein
VPTKSTVLMGTRVGIWGRSKHSCLMLIARDQAPQHSCFVEGQNLGIDYGAFQELYVIRQGFGLGLSKSLLSLSPAVLVGHHHWTLCCQTEIESGREQGVAVHLTTIVMPRHQHWRSQEHEPRGHGEPCASAWAPGLWWAAGRGRPPARCGAQEGRAGGRGGGRGGRGNYCYRQGSLLYSKIWILPLPSLQSRRTSRILNIFSVAQGQGPRKGDEQKLSVPPERTTRH